MRNTPKIIFDLKKIESRMIWASALARANNIHLLFAVKAFPAKEVLTLAAKHLDGFDISNEREFALVKSYIDNEKHVWISGPAHEVPRGKINANWRLALNSEDALLKQTKLRNVALRVNASTALGQRSVGRFGVSFSAAQKSNVDSFSLHLGFQNSSINDLMRIFLRFHQLSLKKPIKALNLGGGWEHFSEADIKWLFSEIKKRSPSFQVFFEPGRWWSQTAGTVESEILDVREHEEGWDVSLTASKLAHLRWSHVFVPKLPLGMSKAGGGKKIRFFGPTCAEDDGILEIKGRIATKSKLVGRQIVLAGVCGYSYAWNIGFNGFPPASIKFVRGKRG